MVIRFINKTTGEVTEVDSTETLAKNIIIDLQNKGFELMSISGEGITIKPSVEDLKDNIFTDLKENSIDEDLEEIHNEIKEELQQEIEEEYKDVFKDEYQDIIDDIEDEYRELLKDEYESAFEPDYLD